MRAKHEFPVTLHHCRALRPLGGRRLSQSVIRAGKKPRASPNKVARIRASATSCLVLLLGNSFFGLRKPVKQKGASLRIGGVWVGKGPMDMNVILSEQGQFQTRSVRRCSQPWRKAVAVALSASPWTVKVTKQADFREAPLLAIVEKPGDEVALRVTRQVRRSKGQLMLLYQRQLGHRWSC